MTFPQTISTKDFVASFPWPTTRRGRWTTALALPLVIGPLWCVVGQLSGSLLGTLSGLVLLAALLTSAVTDVHNHKIYNWVTYSAFLWAVLINAIATMLAMDNESTTRIVSAGPEFLGGVGLGQSLAGAALCFFVTMLGYRLSGIGAGDVKLATAIGAVLGVHLGVFAVAYSYIVAAVAIIAWSVWRQGPIPLLKAGLRTAGQLLLPMWPFPPTSDDHKLLIQPIPLGPYFAIGTLLVVLELVIL